MATSSAKTFVKFLACAAFVLFASAPVYAAQCSVSTTGVNFGSYNVFSSVPLDSTGSISFSCNGKVSSVAISFSTSPNSGSFQPRDMKNSLSPSHLLVYNIYTDSARSIIWGDGTLGTQTVTVQPITAKTVYTETIYGRVPAGQDAYSGSYSDTLTVTVSW